MLGFSDLFWITFARFVTVKITARPFGQKRSDPSYRFLSADADRGGELTLRRGADNNLANVNIGRL